MHVLPYVCEFDFKLNSFFNTPTLIKSFSMLNLGFKILDASILKHLPEMVGHGTLLYLAPDKSRPWGIRIKELCGAAVWSRKSSFIQLRLIQFRSGSVLQTSHRLINRQRCPTIHIS